MNMSTGLYMNTNMMAVRAARNLGKVYKRLGDQTQRLSLGLRITKAADDPANMAVRELMRSEIASVNQGLRNATDGISLIQTAEGALAVIDEKLTRMKELAEQAATGTYTTIQREIMNSEYQAMAMEIDRIASATDFNGVKLLDGSLSTIHGGSGLKVHFGTHNQEAEDYYFVKAGDVRATSDSGLRIGGDAQNDIWEWGRNQGGVESASKRLFSSSAQAFAFGYNHLGDPKIPESDLNQPSYLAGLYQEASGASLDDLVASLNEGTQSRIRITLTGDAASLSSSGAVRICLGDEVFIFGDRSAGEVAGKSNFQVGSATTAASALTTAISQSSSSFWALQDGDQVFVFHKEAGNHDDLLGCEDAAGSANTAQTLDRISWTNVENWRQQETGAQFGMGGEHWVRAEAVRFEDSRFGLRLSGRDVGDGRDVKILAPDLDLGAGNLTFPTPLKAGGFHEIQSAADGRWKAAEIRTQSSAQESLVQLTEAGNRKDAVRTGLGALQNRLENTITQLGIEQENLKRSESQISDLDLAVAMTIMTKDNVISQAATAMLAQSNTAAQLALSLIL